MSTKLQRMKIAKQQRSAEARPPPPPTPPESSVSMPEHSLLVLDLEPLLEIAESTLVALLDPKRENMLVVPDCVIGKMDSYKKQADAIADELQADVREIGGGSDAERARLRDVRAAERAKSFKVKQLQDFLLDRSSGLPILVQSKSDLAASSENNSGFGEGFNRDARYAEQFVLCAQLYMLRNASRQILVVSSNQDIARRCSQRRIEVLDTVGELLIPQERRKRPREEEEAPSPPHRERTEQEDTTLAVFEDVFGMMADK